MPNLNLEIFHVINGLAGKNNVLDSVAIFAAQYFIFIFLIYLIYLWFAEKKQREKILLVGYAALLGLGINFIITLVYFHPRPFMIPTGTLLISHAPETSFPSDHTTIMFAISFTILTFKELRSGIVLFLLAIIGGLARVYAGLHFPADIAGSLFVGLISTGLILYMKRFFSPINRVMIVYFDQIEHKLYKR